jgi:hypothetical protein
LQKLPDTVRSKPASLATSVVGLGLRFPAPSGTYAVIIAVVRLGWFLPASGRKLRTLFAQWVTTSAADAIG